MRKIDVLIIARPDHSYQIYRALLEQNDINFLYITFGLFPQAMSKLNIKRLRYVNGHSYILKRFSILHFLHYKLRLIKHFNEKQIFERSAKRVMSKYSAKIIHYWPNFSNKIVDEYKIMHPETITIAEMYMPNPRTVIETMKAAYQTNGLSFKNDYLEQYAAEIGKRFNTADFILVPSKYVEETMKVTFPNHKYLRIPYGAQISSKYTFTTKIDSITNFVYAGNISLEKGVDQILKFFSGHENLHLHLFGTINESQKNIFDQYILCSNIFFHGSVSRETLQEVLQTMDVGIHPSRFDAYSLAVGEEIGNGLPVIVSDTTGNKDDIIEYGLGLVFKIDNPLSLEDCILNITNIERYNTIKHNIDIYLKNNGSNYCTSIMHLYETILKNGVAI